MSFLATAMAAIFALTGCTEPLAEENKTRTQERTPSTPWTPNPGCISTNPRCMGSCAASDWGSSCGTNIRCSRIRQSNGTYRYECWYTPPPTTSYPVYYGFDVPTSGGPVHHYDIDKSVDGGPYSSVVTGELASGYSCEGFVDSESSSYSELEYRIKCYDDSDVLITTINWIYE